MERLLQARIEDVTEANLRLLVDGAVAEDHDLDFKNMLYEDNDKSKNELAKDIAALANTVGGLIVIGIHETDKGSIAERLSPVVMTSEEEARMRQIIAERVRPLPKFHVRQIATEEDESKGYYLISVPRSPLSPHAVTPKGSGMSDKCLQYPRRNGSTTRWLPEFEVANAYRDRISWAQGDAKRLDEVFQEGLDSTESRSSLQDGERKAWLSIAMVPGLRGECTIDRTEIADVQKRLNGECYLIPALVTHQPFHCRTGFRRVVIPLDMDQANEGVLHLHRDGSGYAGLTIGSNRNPNSSDAHVEYKGEVFVFEQNLALEILNSLRILAFFASDICGADGDASVFATLTSELPIRIATTSGSVWLTSDSLDSVPVGRYTFSLDSIAKSPVEWSAASAEITTDLLQAFRIVEPTVVSTTGHWRPNLFSSPRQPYEFTSLGLPWEI